jgi:hypothetical protein
MIARLLNRFVCATALEQHVAQTSTTNPSVFIEPTPGSVAGEYRATPPENG